MRLPFRVAPSGGWNAEPLVSAWLFAALAAIVGVPVADAFLPPGIHLPHLLAVAPAFTAAASIYHFGICPAQRTRQPRKSIIPNGPCPPPPPPAPLTSGPTPRRRDFPSNTLTDKIIYTA